MRWSAVPALWLVLFPLGCGEDTICPLRPPCLDSFQLTLKAPEALAVGEYVIRLTPSSGDALECGFALLSDSNCGLSTCLESRGCGNSPSPIGFWQVSISEVGLDVPRLETPVQIDVAWEGEPLASEVVDPMYVSVIDAPGCPAPCVVANARLALP